MGKKKMIADKRQLSLFDIGLDAASDEGLPSPAFDRVPGAQPEPVEAEIIAESPRNSTLAMSEPLREAAPQDLEPTLFEKANYDLYLKRREEVGRLAGKSAILLVLLLFVAVLRVQPQEAFLIVKFGAVPLAYAAGVLGWATCLYACFALRSAAQAALQKKRCGPFYRRVLQLSDGRVATWISSVLAALYTICMLASIGLTYLVAGAEMLALGKNIVIGILNIIRIGPWETHGQ